MEPASSKVDLAWIFLFLFLSLLFSFLNEMSCWISEQCDVLAGVVELVLRLTIAEEKIELSVPISSPMHARVCVCEWLQWVACFWCVYVRINPFPPLLFLCVPRSGMLQRRTQLWHNNVSHVEWPTYRGTQWVSRLTGLVVCCRVREWAYIRKVVHVRQCVFVCPLRCSAVCWQLCASLEFSKKLVCCFGLQLSKFLPQSFSMTGE